MIQQDTLQQETSRHETPRQETPLRAAARQAEAILQERPSETPWAAPHTWRLPGTVPVPLADWFRRDEAHDAQMALRDTLLVERPEVVLAGDVAGAAARELLDLVLVHAGLVVSGGAALRPDGVAVALDRDGHGHGDGPPLAAAGRLVQEDLLLLEKRAGEPEHRLVAGCLCFPGQWTLAEKLGHGLARIHAPVADYDAKLAQRVQRMLDGLPPLRPLMRANVAVHASPALFNALGERDARPLRGDRFVRVERQCLVKLPATHGVAFTIHTSLVATESLGWAGRAALAARGATA